MTEYQTIDSRETVHRDGSIKLHGPEGFEGMRRAGQLAARILDEIAPLVVPGVSTGALDDTIRGMMLDGGAVPATPSDCAPGGWRKCERRHAPRLQATGEAAVTCSGRDAEELSCSL